MGEHACAGWDSCPNPAHKAMTLTDFLLARIAELEAVARQAEEQGDPPGSAFYVGSDASVPVSMSPDFVLAECAAQRAAIESAWDDHVTIEGEWGIGRSRERLEAEGCAPAVVSHLALPFADHADYCEEWRP